jgi:quercetin dioxygenase-like cupin family protein
MRKMGIAIAIAMSAGVGIGVAAGWAASNPTSAVWFKQAADVRAAFVKGQPLVERENYKVHASHRDAAGKVEVHEADTDIVYVLEGSATFITGGTMIGGQPIAPEEVRGTAIDGGDTRELKPGDVIIVPAGEPHWFKAVTNPFNYYVVKVRKER